MPCVVYLLSTNECCAAGNEKCWAVTKTKKNTCFLAKEDRFCHPMLYLHVSIMHLSPHSTIQCYNDFTAEDKWGLWREHDAWMPIKRSTSIGNTHRSRAEKMLAFMEHSRRPEFTLQLHGQHTKALNDLIIFKHTQNQWYLTD